MDNVNSPSHYAEHCSVECIDMIRLALGTEGFMAYCLGNAIKYLWRHKYKGGKEDVMKANKYLDWAEEGIDNLPSWAEKLDAVLAMDVKAMKEIEMEEWKNEKNNRNRNDGSNDGNSNNGSLPEVGVPVDAE